MKKWLIKLLDGRKIILTDKKYKKECKKIKWEDKGIAKTSKEALIIDDSEVIWAVREDSTNFISRDFQKLKN